MEEYDVESPTYYQEQIHEMIKYKQINAFEYKNYELFPYSFISSSNSLVADDSDQRLYEHHFTWHERRAGII